MIAPPQKKEYYQPQAPTRLPYTVSLYPTYSVSYLDRDYATHHKKRRLTNFTPGRNESKNNDLNKSAKRKIKIATSFLIGRSELKNVYCNELNKLVKFRVNFITLTLSAKQIHGDNEIKKIMLQPFLKFMRDKYDLKDYIWKAERQKNGNIHFHITTNKYMYYKTIQNKWNQLQQRLGYIDRFSEKFGHRNPHSTEVKAVRKVSKIDSYLAKYISKKGIGETIQGNAYNISMALRKCKPLKYYEYSSQYEKFLEWLEVYIDFEFHSDYFSVFKFKQPIYDSGMFQDSA